MERLRGEIYTAATGSGFGSKPRPVLILQGNAYATLPHVFVAVIESRTEDPPSYRIPVDPTPRNGLRKPSEVCADVILTVRWKQFGDYCGEIEPEIMGRVEHALLKLLGFNVAGNRTSIK